MNSTHDDYENEPRLEYENDFRYSEFNEPWDFTPMDIVGIAIVVSMFLFFFYLVAVNQK